MMMKGAAKASKGTAAKVKGAGPHRSRRNDAGLRVASWYPVETMPATAKPRAKASSNWMVSGDMRTPARDTCAQSRRPTPRNP
jgi:hypothetical protein